MVCSDDTWGFCLVETFVQLLQNPKSSTRYYFFRTFRPHCPTQAGILTQRIRRDLRRLPPTRFELVIFWLRTRCPRPLDEGGQARSILGCRFSSVKRHNLESSAIGTHLENVQLFWLASFRSLGELAAKMPFTASGMRNGPSHHSLEKKRFCWMTDSIQNSGHQ